MAESQVNFENRDLLGAPLWLPGIEDQRRILRPLRDCDRYNDALERKLGKEQAIKHGLMQQLLTGRTRLPGFSEPWEGRQLGELLAYEQPGRYLVSTTDYAVAGTPVLTAGKTFLLGYTPDRHGIYKALPVVIFDDFTTDSKYVNFPFKAKSSAMKMLTARPGVDLRYVYERMQLIHFVAVDHKRRWIAEYSKLQVDVPNFCEQRAIVAVLSDADSRIEKLRDRLAKSVAVKQGMIQQLFAARTPLPDTEAAS